MSPTPSAPVATGGPPTTARLSPLRIPQTGRAAGASWPAGGGGITARLTGGGGGGGWSTARLGGVRDGSTSPSRAASHVATTLAALRSGTGASDGGSVPSPSASSSPSASPRASPRASPPVLARAPSAGSAAIGVSAEGSIDVTEDAHAPGSAAATAPGGPSMPVSSVAPQLKRSLSWGRIGAVVHVASPKAATGGGGGLRSPHSGSSSGPARSPRQGSLPGTVSSGLSSSDPSVSGGADGLTAVSAASQRPFSGNTLYTSPGPVSPHGRAVSAISTPSNSTVMSRQGGGSGAGGGGDLFTVSPSSQAGRRFFPGAAGPTGGRPAAYSISSVSTDGSVALGGLAALSHSHGSPELRLDRAGSTGSVGSGAAAGAAGSRFSGNYSFVPSLLPLPESNGPPSSRDGGSHAFYGRGGSLSEAEVDSARAAHNAAGNGQAGGHGESHGLQHSASGHTLLHHTGPGAFTADARFDGASAIKTTTPVRMALPPASAVSSLGGNGIASLPPDVANQLMQSVAGSVMSRILPQGGLAPAAPTGPAATGRADMPAADASPDLHADGKPRRRKRKRAMSVVSLLPEERDAMYDLTRMFGRRVSTRKFETTFPSGDGGGAGGGGGGGVSGHIHVVGGHGRHHRHPRDDDADSVEVTEAQLHALRNRKRASDDDVERVNPRWPQGLPGADADVDGMTSKQLRALPLSHPAIMKRVVDIARILSKTNPTPMPLVELPDCAPEAEAEAAALHAARATAAANKRAARRRLSVLRTR